ncbi:hypothetical protein [Mesobacillus foraminis]|uniref:hypothetical protein n=1 Tax=Mesobacillus foraminis TaxID=279826 RepID=UPI000EF457A1|nr:hypothetical protein [Mesobacillus foraminis]
MLPFLVQELATRLGERVEIALDETLIEGVLSTVSGNLIVVVPTSGYAAGPVINISLEAVNYISFPQG